MFNGLLDAISILSELSIETCGIYGCKYTKEEIALLRNSNTLQDLWTDSEHLAELKSTFHNIHHVRIRVDYVAKEQE